MVRQASVAVDRSGVHVAQFRPPNATFSQSLWTGGHWRCGLPPHARGSADVSLYDSGGSHWLWMQGALIRTLPAPYLTLPHPGNSAGLLVRSEVPGSPLSLLLVEKSPPRHRYFDGFRWVDRELPGIDLEQPLRAWNEDANEQLWGAATSATMHGSKVGQPLLVHDGTSWHVCRTPLTRIDVLNAV